MNKIDAFFVCASLFLVWIFAIFMIPAPYINFLYASIACWYVGTRIGKLNFELQHGSGKTVIRDLMRETDGMFALIEMQGELIHEQNGALKAMQARIDALMLEYCPEEMSPQQIANYEAHQRAVKVH